MKNIKQIRENYKVIMEKENAELSKLTALIRAGLFDQKKLTIVKRSLAKDPADLTLAERKTLIDLLNSLMSEVLSSSQAYRGVKQGVMSEEYLDEAKTEYLSKFDPRQSKNWPSETDMPTVLMLKRKAIRIYPDFTKVALYYAQAIDKYVSIPFTGINTDVAVSVSEQYVTERASRGTEDDAAKREEAASRMRKDRDERIKGKWYVGSDKKTKDDIYAHIKDKVKERDGDAYQKAANIGGMLALGGARATASAAKSAKSAASNTAKGYRYSQATDNKGRISNMPRDNGKVISPKNSPAHKVGGVAGSAVKKVKGALGLAEEQKTYRQKLVEKRMMKEYSVADAADDVTDVLVPYKSAVKNYQKGNYKAAAVDAALDTVGLAASAFTGGTSYAGTTAAKGAIRAGVKGATKGASKADDVVKPVSKGASKADDVAATAKGASKTGTGAKITDRAKKVAKGVGLAGAGAAVGSAMSDSGSRDDKEDQKAPKDFSLQTKVYQPKKASADAARSEIERRKLYTETETREPRETRPQPAGFSLQNRMADKIGTGTKSPTDMARKERERRSLYKESMINQIRNIKEETSLQVADGHVYINKNVADKMVHVYESLNKQNQKKVDKLISENVEGFKKFLNFVVRQ